MPSRRQSSVIETSPRKPSRKLRPFRRVETPPGAQTQSDWVEVPADVGDANGPAKLYGFVMRLSHSRIKVADIRLPEPGVEYPVCIAGERACPPEDCGSVPGYEEILEILKDPKHEEYEERLEWLGGAYDPEKFDLEHVNGLLRLKRA